MDFRGITFGLTPEMVEANYRRGQFPMADSETGLVTWHRPRRRALIPLDDFHVSRSLTRTLQQVRFQITFDTAFDAVMEGCADRPEGTWISSEFRTVYGELHRAGKAHSVEVWMGERLAGGLYGVHLGGAFFAESKFHRVTDMSKVALAQLVFRLRDRGFRLLEVQYLTRHLAQFGTISVPHATYLRILSAALALKCEFC
jgi:leucyl/phenylalanyl-tRNA--protein transferase